MKTAISMPDALAKRVDRQAKHLGLSRSEFLARAAERYLATLGDEQVTASYDAAYADDDDEMATFRRKAARASLLAVEWKE